MPTIVKYILVFFISMVPIIELRGAVPIGVTYFGLNEYITLAVCIVGNMIPVPIIYLFARKVLIWGSKLKHGSGIFKWFLQKGEKAGQKLTAKSKKNGAFIALMLFVGIPLPGTGAWTGTLAASMLDFDAKKTTKAVVLGVLMAGIIMLAISLLAKAGITSVSDLF
ncbi:MAG: small multi-drug export protein [Clostridiales bacterium]|nr:small multi-drug export protein [Clostridiales bacterium]MBR2821654.1 small multi-drug export protein [Clostridiales bacterium]